MSLDSITILMIWVSLTVHCCCHFFVSSCRKLEEVGSQNSDLLAVIAKREDTIHSNQLRLEEKTRECSLLSRKLEEALDDARQQVWNHQQLLNIGHTKSVIKEYSSGSENIAYSLNSMTQKGVFDQKNNTGLHSKNIQLNLHFSVTPRGFGSLDV